MTTKWLYFQKIKLQKSSTLKEVTEAMLFSASCQTMRSIFMLLPFIILLSLMNQNYLSIYCQKKYSVWINYDVKLVDKYIRIQISLFAYHKYVHERVKTISKEVSFYKTIKRNSGKNIAAYIRYWKPLQKFC